MRTGDRTAGKAVDEATHLDIVLELLDDEPGGAPVVRGDVAGSPELDAAIDRLRESTEAQLVLLGLASAFASETTDSGTGIVEQVRSFTVTAHERLGVDLLQTAIENPERVPPTVPRELLDGRE